MSYDRDMLESMRRVEATRPARLHQTFPRLTPEEKQALLQKFHPDYRPESMRPLAVGPNAGERVPHEVADLLEGTSRIDPEAFDLTRPDEDVDILIVGGGGAGTSAAIIPTLLMTGSPFRRLYIARATSCTGCRSASTR